MKKLTTIILVSVFAVAVIAGCIGQSNSQGTDYSTGGTPSYKGNSYFTVTDAAANMGAVSSVKITFDSLKVHSAQQGWVNVSSSTQTYDLLKLKAEGTQSLMANTQLNPDSYDKIRLNVQSVVVTDANGDHQAKLPSNEFIVITELVVKANTTSTAAFDFIVDESLHTTGKGDYIMAPVVQLDTRENATIDVSSSTNVKISGGKSSVIKVGMDIKGNVGVGLKIPADAILDVRSTGIVDLR
ncbi:MAG: DUF4382 domain-containing protein [Candidatus Aenigmarchaeota archaeon]|nr:DUF4382 domain-containing protein [Candidatus Aenigmarchaeota archaeon]